DRSPAAPHRMRWHLLLALAAAASIGAAAAAGWAWNAWGAAIAPFLDGSPDAFHRWVRDLGAWAPAIFVLVTVAQVVVAPIPGGALPPVAALAFGPWAALALSLA